MSYNNQYLIKVFPVFISTTIGLINVLRAYVDTVREQMAKARDDLIQQYNSSREFANQLIVDACGFFKH